MKLKILVTFLLFLYIGLNSYDCKVLSSRGGWFGGGSSSVNKPISTSNSGGWFGGGSSSASKPIVPSTGGWFGGGSSHANRTINRPVVLKTIDPMNRSYTFEQSEIFSSNDQNKLDDDESWNHFYEPPFFDSPKSKEFSPTVLSTATHFGLFGKLPLYVPSNDPLLYCSPGHTSDILINYQNSTYGCSNGVMTKSCYRYDSILREYINTCAGTTLNCDATETFSIYCINGYLVSNQLIHCISVSELVEINSLRVLNCFSYLSPKTTTESHLNDLIQQKRPKSLTILARVHMFLLWVIGKSDILDV
ncbi:unnamed protein product [Diamesa serratosioi]